MDLWSSMLGSVLIVPVLMIIVGAVLAKRPPQKINRWIGYRTSASMKNKEAWAFANKYSGKLMCIAGIIMLPITIVVMLPLRGTAENTLMVWATVIPLVQIVVIVLLVAVVQCALKKKFGSKN